MKQALPFKYPNPSDPNDPLSRYKNPLCIGFKNIWKSIIWLFRLD